MRNPPHSYLLPARRQMENRLALLAACYGLWIIGWNIFSDHNPIGWTGLSEMDRLCIGQGFLWGGVIHWFGVQLNGGHRWSPAYRVVGLTTVSITWSLLFWHVPHISSSAFPVYVYFSFLFLKAMFSAGTDLADAVRGGGECRVK